MSSVRCSCSAPRSVGGRSGWFLLAIGLASAAHAADPVSEAYDASTAANERARASQQKVEQLDDATRAALEKYRSILWQTQQLKVYAQQLQQMASTQAAEKAELQKQLVGLAVTERDILPLTLRMTDALEKFVALDLPFLQAERQERLASLHRMMADGSIGLAEKYRRVIEAYQIEIDYGRSLGAERAELPLGGTAKIVDVLRVGRTALFYLSLDGEDAGRWDQGSRKWVAIGDSYIPDIRKGLRIARELAAAELLVLPMPAAASEGAAP